MKQLSTIYAGILNQFEFKYQTVFSSTFDKQDEDDQVLDKNEFYININFNHNLTQPDRDSIDIRCQLERPIENQERKDSIARFDK